MECRYDMIGGRVREVSARNTSQRAEQRKLREQMRGLGMSGAEIAAEMARRYRLRPRTAWRTAWGWTLEEAASGSTPFARRRQSAVTSLTGSRLSEWENWPLSTRKPSVTGVRILAEVYQCGVLDLIDFHDREKLQPPNCSHSAEQGLPWPLPRTAATGGKMCGHPASRVNGTRRHAAGQPGATSVQAHHRGGRRRAALRRHAGP